MKLCMSCLEELFDKDIVCYKCNNDKLIEHKEFQQIRSELQLAKRKELEGLLLMPKYKCVNDYLNIKQKRDEKYPNSLQYGNSSEEVNPSYVKACSTPSTPTITCPYCKSTDCKKISGLSKAGSVALWGIFALGKTTKQWHCNNCGADF